MSISLPSLNALNVQEIEMLKAVSGISFDSKTQEFVCAGGFSIAKLMKIYSELGGSIWNRENVQTVVEELEQTTPNRTRVHYFGNGRPINLESYLSKMGLLEHETLVEDPLCFPMTVKPEFKDHITKSPKAYVKHIFENAMSMIFLEEWVRKGYVYFTPSLPLFDIGSFWKLAELNEQIATSAKNFEHHPGFVKSFKYSSTESKISLMLEMSRLTQTHYTIQHMKRIFPGISDEEAQKRLEMLQSQTLEEREDNIVQWALDGSKLIEQEKLALLSYFERTRPFNIERFLDISKLDGGIMATAGMPLLHATYLSERFNCIPSTDNLGLMYGYEAWCQILGQDLDPNFEKTRIKVDLPFSFLDKIPLDFIEKAREQGKARVASVYLDQEWGSIRQTHDLPGYQKAAADYAAKISSDFHQLEEEHEIMLDELTADVCKSGFLSLGAFVAFNLTSQLPLAIVGGLCAMFASSFDTVKTFRKNKNELQVKPLAIFLEAKKASKTKNK